MAEVRDVPARLEDAARLFCARNREYGNNYRYMGCVMAAMYPLGLTVTTRAEWTRLMLQVLRVMKETRYASNFHRGGHQDSMEDLAVYAQMAAETDEMAAGTEELVRESQVGNDPLMVGQGAYELPVTDQIEKYHSDTDMVVPTGYHQWWSGRLYKKSVNSAGTVTWTEATPKRAESGMCPAHVPDEGFLPLRGE